jgi:hypothetical protein
MTKMIQINNLSQYEVEMLDHMWSLETEQEFLEWFYLLDDEDKLVADYLQRMIILAGAEQLIEETEYKDAKQVLKKFALH